MMKASSYVQADFTLARQALSLPSGVGPGYARANGEVAGSVRDIIDTGKLHDSLKFKEKFLKSKVSIEVIYTTPYAAITHYGGYIVPYGNQKLAPVYIPGRPWIEAALNGTYGMPQFDINTPVQKGVMEAWNSTMGT